MGKKKSEESVEEGPHSFSVLLSKLENGGLIPRVSEEMLALNTELRDIVSTSHLKAKGTLTLKLDVIVEPNGVVVIQATCDTKTPKLHGGTSVMWLTKGGNLTPTNPKQLELPVRSLEDPERREIDEDEEEEARSL